MKRSALILVALLSATFLVAQSLTYDYVWIQCRAANSEIHVVSTEAEARIVPIELPKGKDFGDASLKASMQMVQEYELMGWERIEVLIAPFPVWIMRKPKPK